jgi:hypothetical protein
MARLTCARCGTAVARDEIYCPSCGAVLVEAGAMVEVEERESEESLGDQREPTKAPAESSERALCPHCGHPLNSPDDRVCMQCLREIAPSRPEAARALGVTITFGHGELRVAPGEELTLGRDPTYASAATLARFDNVSRKHATVGVDRSGRAWVLDHNSTNGTFVDGVPVTSTAQTPLRDGCRLQLASDVVATIRSAEEDLR